MSVLKSASIILLACGVALSGCKIVKTQSAEEAAEARGDNFNADRSVADIWETKLKPYFAGKTASLDEVMAAASADADAAGAKYGHRENRGDAPWTFMAKLEGTVVAAQTKSRAAYVDVDSNGDGRADARVQIGPTVRGSAIRDSLSFLNFNDFRNQIDWAQFGKALNVRVNEEVLSKLPREDLIGMKIEAQGAFPLPSKGQLPLVTPVSVSLEK
ncbi:hypothetical protein GCM10011491_31910 [Brucella endophytica]|uniref:DUF2291 domain-containing protein n=1 Tax=Brucella endophytica TaxID=1963359 RepID=A0A916SHP9_9HYPH|nr:DUF2291 family protein [Brucella endophytica]GGB01414.1 hypothetical protein GCM10011491_31910 [Brucella endophytica]